MNDSQNENLSNLRGFKNFLKNSRVHLDPTAVKHKITCTLAQNSIDR